MDNNALTIAQQLQAVGFDISAYEDVQTGTVIIRDPLTNAPTPLAIELAGPEHPKRRKDDFNRARRLRQDIMKTGKVQLDDPEEEELAKTEKLADYTIGWTVNGQAMPFSREAALALYSDPKRRWLRSQVATALDERERFIKRSAIS